MPWPFGLSSLFPGDPGITQTVNAIREAVKYSLTKTPEIRYRAEQIVRGCAERDESCEVLSVFNWVQQHYRYLKDPYKVELVKSPEISDQEISAHGIFQGDCDDVSAYLAALLLSIGHPVNLVTISVPGKGTDFRHIYPRVWLSKAQEWKALEATVRRYPAGWEASSDRVREYVL